MSDVLPGGGAPPPNIAQLPLPPGMSLEQFFELQQAAVNITICVSVGVALVLFDYFILLRDELSLYKRWDSVRNQSPAFYAFVVLRYSGILAVLPALFFSAVESQHCQFAASISQVGVVLVTASSGIIFAYRVFAIWQGDRIVMGAISVLYLIMVGCWIATATALRASVGPPAPIGSNCILQGVPSWSPIGFASSVAFDTVILILGLIKLRGQLTASSGVTRQIYRDNIMYFIIVSTTNLITLVIQALPPGKRDLLKPAVLPFSSVITYSMGCRVFLNLRLFHRRGGRHHNVDELPLTSNYSGSNAQFSTNCASNQLPIGSTAFTDSTGTTGEKIGYGYPRSIPDNDSKAAYVAVADTPRTQATPQANEIVEVPLDAPRLHPVRPQHDWK